MERAKVIGYERSTLKLVYSIDTCADCCYALFMQADDEFGVLATPQSAPGVCDYCEEN